MKTYLNTEEMRPIHKRMSPPRSGTDTMKKPTLTAPTMIDVEKDHIPFSFVRFSNGLLCSLSFVVFFLFSGNTFAQTYSQSFTSGVTATAQCTAWNTWRAGIGTPGSYSAISISGTGGTRTATGAAAVSIITALKNGTALGSTASGGYNWVVGTCGAGIELTAGAATIVCQCNNSFTVRPCIGNANWGGANGTATCASPSQTITVTLSPACTPSSISNPSSTPAGTLNVWTGAGSSDGLYPGDWNRADNWSNGVPTISHNVVIPYCPSKQPVIYGSGTGTMQAAQYSPWPKAYCNTLTVHMSAGATLTFNTNSALLDVRGTF